MKPALSPPHGTSLGTTAGITTVVSMIAAVSMLGLCRNATGFAVNLGAFAGACFILGAGALYTGRNLIGQALDLASTAPGVSCIAAARGLCWFHLGMAGIFGGSGFAAWFGLYPLENVIVLLTPIAGFAMVAVALTNAASWTREVYRRQALHKDDVTA